MSWPRSPPGAAAPRHREPLVRPLPRRRHRGLDHLQDAAEVARCEAELAQVGEMVAVEPERYELHQQDETHLATNPYRCRMWHRRGHQPTLPAAGINRRVTIFGSVEVLGRGRVEVVQARQHSAGLLRYLEALEVRHRPTLGATHGDEGLFQAHSQTQELTRTYLDLMSAHLLIRPR